MKLKAYLLYFFFALISTQGTSQIPKGLMRIQGSLFEPNISFSEDSVHAFCPCYVPAFASGTWYKASDSTYHLTVTYKYGLHFKTPTDTLEGDSNSASILLELLLTRQSETCWKLTFEGPPPADTLGEENWYYSRNTASFYCTHSLEEWRSDKRHPRACSCNQFIRRKE